MGLVRPEDTTIRRITYEIPVNGLATDFTESELPLNFALRFRNRFINRDGGAEKRRGMVQFNDTLPDNSTVTGLHELVDKLGNATILASNDTGKIYRLDGAAWILAHTLASSLRIRSRHFQDRLIFYNGTDRPVNTEDGIEFEEHKALIEKGLGGDETAANRLNDGNVTDWSADTFVAVNDLVSYPSLEAFAVVTGVSASAVVHTAVSASARGLGLSISGEPTTGTPYEVVDLVPLNVVDNGIELDNTAVAGPGTDAITVAVSGVTNWLTTDARVGDYVRNTTRTSVAQIEAIASASLTVTKVSGQISGDALLFSKSAMPIPYFIHVHYDRAYYVDARDRRQMIVSDPFNDRGVTSDGGVLEDVTFFAGALQPKGDVIVALGSYQNFFVIGGEHNVYLFSGTTPVGANADFLPQALFPQGVVSQDGMQTIGNDLLFVGHDGVQSVSQIADASQLGRDTLTYPISDTLRRQLDAVSSPDEIQLFHYRQRSWVCLKVGTEMYVLNYSTRGNQRQANYTGDILGQQAQGSISLFDGPFAQGAVFLERRSDQLLVGSAGGKVHLFDQDGVYDDDGILYSTALQPGWLMLEKPGTKSTTVKSLKYIEPIFEGDPSIEYEITATGGFDFDSSDVITVAASSNSSQVGSSVIPFTIGGAPISSVKHALRVRGQALQIQFATNDDKGPDTISRYTLYAAVHGAQ